MVQELSIRIVLNTVFIMAKTDGSVHLIG